MSEEYNLEDFEYLTHHIHSDEGVEQIHHCLMYDHIGNMFEQEHLLIDNGKVFLGGKELKDGIFHVLKGLEPTQDICWSDSEAVDNNITPKRMFEGMTFKQKAKEW